MQDYSILIYILLGFLAAALPIYILLKPRLKKLDSPKKEELTSKEALEAAPEKALPEAIPEKTLSSALSKTKEQIFGRLRRAFSDSQLENWDEMEEILFTSDLGPKTVQDLMDFLEEDLSSDEKKSAQAIEEKLKQKMRSILLQIHGELDENTKLLGLDEEKNSSGPTVWMIVGVNGSGKTTSLGKLASLLSQKNKKVMVAAGDTFRAAADQQLRVWADRANVEIYSPENIKDPSAVAYEACQKAKTEGFDHVLVDTAGRLHTQKNLMEELKKMKRVIQKVIPEAPHETLLILDANNGQNALNQAKEFHQALDLSGVIFTKMDGTAKAGVAFGIANEVKLPIKRIGIGERLQDLKTFDTQSFVDSIFT